MRLVEKEISPGQTLCISLNRRYAGMGKMHGGLCIFDIRSGEVIFTGGSREMGSTYPVMAADWSADSRYIAGGFWTGEVKVWDLSPLRKR